MVAYQLSDRLGKLDWVNNGNRVLISGQAKTYSVGSLWTEKKWQLKLDLLQGWLDTGEIKILSLL